MVDSRPASLVIPAFARMTKFQGIEAPARDSARVVAVLEVAARSMKNDGWPERVEI